MTPPIPPRQSTTIEAIADSVIMKLLGIGILLLGAYLLVKEVVPLTAGTDPRQSTVAICIFAALIVLGAGLAIGSRFITLLTGITGAASTVLPWRKGDK